MLNINEFTNKIYMFCGACAPGWYNLVSPPSLALPQRLRRQVDNDPRPSRPAPPLIILVVCSQRASRHRLSNASIAPTLRCSRLPLNCRPLQLRRPALAPVSHSPRPALAPVSRSRDPFHYSSSDVLLHITCRTPRPTLVFCSCSIDASLPRSTMTSDQPTMSVVRIFEEPNRLS